MRTAPHRSPRTALAVSLVCLLAASLACDGSSPSAPDAAPLSARVLFTDDTLTAHQTQMAQLIEQTFADANRTLLTGVLEFQVYSDPLRSIPGWGLGGYTLGPQRIDIVAEPAFPGFASILEERLPQITAHEIHHAVRAQRLGFYMTLLEALVAEGLADHFAVDTTGAPLAPWSDAFGEDQTQRYLELARPQFDDPGFDFGAWFFGSGGLYPRWTGYTLGYRIVRDYLERNPGTSAAQLVGTPAEAFRPP